MLKWQPVASSNIDSIAFDAEESELHVKFNSGAEYVYLGVPATLYDSLLEAESKGRYLNDAIKGRYEYYRV